MPVERLVTTSNETDTNKPTKQKYTGVGAKKYERFFVEDFVSAKQTSDVDLPDPQILIENLTLCVFEIIAGVRTVNQISRWLTDDLFNRLSILSNLNEQARIRHSTKRSVPKIRVGNIIGSAPTKGVYEAAVMVHGMQRSKVVAIRLEAYADRWRASSLNVLGTEL